MKKLNEQMWKRAGWEFEESCRINNSSIFKYIKLIHINRYADSKYLLEPYESRKIQADYKLHQSSQRQKLTTSYLIHDYKNDDSQLFWSSKKEKHKKIKIKTQNNLKSNQQSRDNEFDQFSLPGNRVEPIVVRSYSPLKKLHKPKSRGYLSFITSQNIEKNGKKLKKQCTINFQGLTFPKCLKQKSSERKNIRKNKTLKQLTYFRSREGAKNVFKKAKSEKRMAQTLNTLKISYEKPHKINEA